MLLVFRILGLNTLHMKKKVFPRDRGSQRAGLSDWVEVVGKKYSAMVVGVVVAVMVPLPLSLSLLMSMFCAF